jgi:hypothetical protein
MGADDKRQPGHGDGREREAAERRERLAAALRDNLRKRKQQARRRHDAARDPSDGDPDGA